VFLAVEMKNVSLNQSYRFLNVDGPEPDVRNYYSRVQN
jgi:hypothetical protein